MFSGSGNLLLDRIIRRYRIETSDKYSDDVRVFQLGFLSVGPDDPTWASLYVELIDRSIDHCRWMEFKFDQGTG